MTVYNCASGGKIGFTTKQLLDIGITSTCKEFAMDHMIWKANGGSFSLIFRFRKCILFQILLGVTACKAYNNIRTLFFQILPALLIDFALKLQQKEPR